MKGDKRKERTKQKIRSKSEFVKVSDDEALHEFHDSTVRTLVNDGHNLRYTFLKLNDTQSDLKIKVHQLNNYSKDGVEIEKIDGVTKPEYKLQSEYMLIEYIYKRIVLEFNQLKDKIKKSTQFTDEEIVNIVNGEFDYTAWEKAYYEKLKTVQPEIKTETD